MTTPNAPAQPIMMSVPTAPDEPKTTDVPTAGWRYLKLGRQASYAAAARGDIPTIRVGRLLRVPIAAMEKRLAAVE